MCLLLFQPTTEALVTFRRESTVEVYEGAQHDEAQQRRDEGHSLEDQVVVHVPGVHQHVVVDVRHVRRPVDLRTSPLVAPERRVAYNTETAIKTAPTIVPL